MRTRFGSFLPLAAATALLLLLAAAPACAKGAVGETAPAFKLSDATGKTHELSDYSGKVVVLEWINPNCPFSARHAREKTMTELARRHGQVVWLAVNSTSDSHPNYLEPAEHLAWNRDNGIDYAVLYDPKGTVGKAYGAKTTPHMYIVDEQGKIVYNGAIDDDPSGRKAEAQRANYVGLGLVAQAADRQPDPAATKPYGCSVKY
ncbi:MAG TPA: redoxin domain-containing protein [Thermoanaerobaculia bacterium]|nr:redoxin domain-containing protein [Thermoanaerobaculia bacterium]